MKTKTAILVLSFIIIVNGSLSAQTGKGTILIGEFTNINLTGEGTPLNMNLGWSTFKQKSDSGDEDNSNSDKQFAISLTPRMGYFIINNFAVGLDLTIDYTHTEGNGGDYVSNMTRFGAGPFIRYYVPSKKLLPFAEASYSIGSSKTKWEYDNTFDGDYNTQVQQWGLGFGLGIPMGEKVAFDALIGYHSFIYKDKEDNDDNLRFIVGTVGLKLGLTVFL